MMTVEKLKMQLAEVQASLQDWRSRKAQAEQATVNAQQQIDLHGGHIERIGMWLREMEQTGPVEQA